MVFSSPGCGKSLLMFCNLWKGNFQLLYNRRILRVTVPYLEVITFNKHCFHTSSVFFKRRKTREEKKLGEQRDISYISARKSKPVIDVWRNMTVRDLGAAMGKSSDFVLELMTFVDNTFRYNRPNSVIDDWNTLRAIVHKGDCRVREISKPTFTISFEDNDIYRRPPADPSKLVRRPPVVTIMGHVDHGKTTLLDFLRHTQVVKSEFGGITQHIGAFSVEVKGQNITFLDTPGHAAFSAMRSRGAHCTDIVILVVAAEDGVMEQTVESIKMAKKANVPIIVAINKIDKPEADIEKTKKMLMMHNIVVEDLGGDVQAVPISALYGTNIDGLMDAVIAQSELSNFSADPTGFVEGVIIESKLDPHRGKLATALIQRGTLRKGCILTAGVAWGRVRIMVDAHRNIVSEAPPSTPVEVVGWRNEVLPMPGDIIIEVESEQVALSVIRYRNKKNLDEKALHDLPEIMKKIEGHRKVYKKEVETKRKLGIAKLFRKGLREKESPEMDTSPRFNIIIKGDVEGSVEAILDMLVTYNSPLCQLDIVHYGTGKVTISDVEIAELFKATIYPFNVECLPDAKSAASAKKIPIHPQNVIYKLMDDIKSEIDKILPPKQEDEVIGEAEVLQLFLIDDSKKKIPVAGCRCVKGELKKGSPFKVIRNGKVIHTGNLSSMRHLKMEVTSIKKEQECGLMFQDKSILFEPGDIIQCFKTYEVTQHVEWNPF